MYRVVRRSSTISVLLLGTVLLAIGGCSNSSTSASTPSTAVQGDSGSTTPATSSSDTTSSGSSTSSSSTGTSAPGGSDDSSSGSDTGSTAGTGASDLKHFAFSQILTNGKSGDLYRFTSAAPTTPEKIAETTDTAEVLMRADLDLVNKQLRNLDSDSVVFAKQGKLYRLSLAETPATAVQISSEPAYCPPSGDPSGALSLFHHWDPATPTEGWLIYANAGNDGSCGSGDDKRHLVQLNMSSETPPLTVPSNLSIVTELDNDQGKPAGWLATENTILKRYSNDLSTSEAIPNAPNATYEHIGSQLDYEYLLATGAASGIYRLRTADNQLSQVTDASLSPGHSLVLDPDNLYWINPPIQTLVKRATDGSGTDTIIADWSATSPSILMILGATENYVLVQRNTPDHEEIFSVNKQGGSDPILIAESDLNLGLSSLMATPAKNDRVLLFRSPASDPVGKVELRSMATGDMSREWKNTALVGRVIDSLAFDDDRSDYLLMADNLTADQFGYAYSVNSRINAYETENFTLTSRPGSLANLNQVELITAFGWAPQFALSIVHDQQQQDIFYADVRQSGSFQAVTQAPANSGFRLLPMN